MLAIAVLTLVSGVGQLLVPGLVLHLLSASATPTDRHLFATVGMFMAVVGGLLLQAMLNDTGQRAVVPWVGAQKLGASGAVALGVHLGVFGPVALLVASFDLLSAGIAFCYWRRLPRAGGPDR
jgi:hypothetical protein